MCTHPHCLVSHKIHHILPCLLQYKNREKIIKISLYIHTSEYQGLLMYISMPSFVKYFYAHTITCKVKYRHNPINTTLKTFICFPPCLNLVLPFYVFVSFFTHLKEKMAYMRMRIYIIYKLHNLQCQTYSLVIKTTCYQKNTYCI